MREKYISPEDAKNSEIVYISGKHAEEVGLEKLARRQAQLQGIHTLVLDRMCLRHRAGDTEHDQAVASLCANITSLDLGGNLFETWEEIMALCRLFPKLVSLTLDGNRFTSPSDPTQTLQLPNIRHLSLESTLLTPAEIATAAAALPSLSTLILAHNNHAAWPTHTPLPATLHTLDLSNNNIQSLTSLSHLLPTLPNLHTLHLKSNTLTSPPSLQPPPNPLSPTLHTLDLRSNAISTWALITTLPPLFPALQNLHVAQNPLYTTLAHPTTRQPLTPEDGWMLTLARLPKLKTLNYSSVDDKQRLNAETYYLGLVAREVAGLKGVERERVLEGHPRWGELCAEYGEPVVEEGKEEGEGGPGALGRRFVEVAFSFGGRETGEAEEWMEEVPRSASVYALLGRVGKRVGVMPLRLRLVWETGERDPIRGDVGVGYAVEWWDSEDEDTGLGEGEWAAREVELVHGTRMVGTYFEGKRARVRVELK